MLIASACTQPGGSNHPTPFDRASAFLNGLAARDFEAVDGMLTAETYLGAEDLRKVARNVLASAAAPSMEVATVVAGETPTSVSEPDDGATASVAYGLSYASEAAARPVTLEGDLDLVFDATEGSWEVEWSKRVLFPGVPKADRFSIENRWLSRGPILDADGKPLAVGPAESRRYPYGSLGGAIVGHVGPATKEVAAEFGVATADYVGVSGLEEGLQELLAGRPTSRLTLLDRRGRVVEVLGRRKGKPGRKVKTTLDVDVLRATESAYGGTAGGAVVMDPATGGVLAAVSSSPFDPNGYVGVSAIEPFNRAFEGLYPPGSAMKVVTAAAALDSGTVTENTQLTGPSEYQGVRNFESGEFGTLDFGTAVQYSVNTAFAQVALKLGAKRLTRYAEAFGFNHEPEMPATTATSSFPPLADQGDLMWGSIGQAQVLATPLQMASIAATVANDGVRLEPSIVRGDRTDGTRVISKKAARTLTRLMIRVVEAGTGTAARLSGVDVAGKTGTAEVDVGGERKNHAWFICFAPAGDPEVAVAVVSEYGGIGGQVAAPIARNILARSLLIVQSEEFREGG